jgi:hypothetical protein
MATEMSDAGLTGVVTMAVLSLGVSSGPNENTVARLVTVPLSFNLATIVAVTEARPARVPISQVTTPAAWEQVPWETTAET